MKAAMSMNYGFPTGISAKMPYQPAIDEIGGRGDVKKNVLDRAYLSWEESGTNTEE